VAVLGDIPILGYAFQSHDNQRHKRNLLIFVTPTILDQRCGTGLEDQISGLRHTGEEYADPNAWRNNAKGAVQPGADIASTAADYAKPGTPPAVEQAWKCNSRAT
jgi:type II secretory pathway component GspD/PulD (secretin)